MSAKSKSAASPKPLFTRWYVFLLLAVLVILIGLFLSRSWIKNTANPKLKRIYYGYQARTAFAGEVKALGDPLNTLGFKNIKGASSKCSYDPVFSYTDLQLQCTSEHQNYVVIGNNQTTKTLFTTKAKDLDDLLKANSWTETSNTTSTIGEWFQGITSGKDWYADEGAYKNNGNKHCSLDFMVAYSNPKPPAFTIQVACSSPVLEKIKNDILF